MSWSTTAPTIDGQDISNFTGSSTDAGNVNGGNDTGTFMAQDRLGVGQTFTTGGNAGGYLLDAFSYQHVMYASDASIWSVDSGWGGGSQYQIKFGTLDGTTFNTFTTESANVGDADFGNTTALNVAGGQSGTGGGEWWTYSFSSPLVLAPNTTYAFSSFINGGAYFETNGNNADATYGGGVAFNEEAGTATAVSGDHVFHANLAVNSESVWNVNADGLWTTSGNWFNGVPAMGSNPILGSATVPGENIAGDRTVTLNSSTISLNSITLSNNDGDYFIVDNGGGESLTLTGGGINVTGRHWVRASLAGSDISVSGSGELVLDHANAFTGGLNINEARVSVTDTGAIPSTAGITIQDGGALRFFGEENGFFNDTHGTSYSSGSVGGTITLGADSVLQVYQGADVTFNGRITGGGDRGPAYVEVNSNSSQGSSGHLKLTSALNDYAGKTQGWGTGVIEVAAGSKLGISDGTATNGTILSNDSQLLLSGVALGNEHIFMDANSDAEVVAQPQIKSTGTSSISGNVYASEYDSGGHYGIEAASGQLTLSGTLGAFDNADSSRTYVFNAASGATITAGHIVDAEVDSNGNVVPGFNAGDNVNVVKRGLGTLNINTGAGYANAIEAAQNYWLGSTVVEAGTLKVTPNAGDPNVGELATSSITVKAGAVFDVSSFGTYNLQPSADYQQALSGGGTVNATGKTLGIWNGNTVSPGDSVGTLTVQGNANLTYNTSFAVPAAGNFNYELGTTAAGANDRLNVTGTLNISGASSSNQFVVNLATVAGPLQTTPNYTLIQAGTLTGGAANNFKINFVDSTGADVTASSRYATTASVAAIAGNAVQLNVGSTALALTWSGPNDGAWDLNGASNWNSGTEKFMNLDSVLFADAGGAVNVTQDVSPSTMTVVNGAYSFSGSDINAYAITVSSSGTASFANNVAGNVVVASTGTVAGDGTFKDSVTVQSGGKLQVGGANLASVTGGAISWNYDRFGTVNNDRVAGVEAVANWNNSWPDNPTVNLVDESGAATSLDLAYNSFGSYSVNENPGPVGNPGQDADGSYNRELLNGYLNSGPAPWGPSITYSDVQLTEIPYDSYDIIVYFSSDVAGRAGDVTDGTTTYSFNTVGPTSVSGTNAVLAETTDVGGTYATAANYAVFSGLTGVSQTITVQMRDDDQWGGIAGFQVVPDSASEVLTGQTMSVLGDVLLEDGSTASFNIGAAGFNDLLDVAGALAVADGFILEVLLDDSVSVASLAAGDSWDLFDFATATGAFDELDFDLPTLTGALAWDTSNLLVDGTLSIISTGLAGDYNGDGTVDAADYAVWRNGDSPDSSQAGYDLWRANYGMTSATVANSSQATAPEPGTLLLLLGAVAARAFARRRAA